MFLWYDTNVLLLYGSDKSWNRFVLQQLHTETLEEKLDPSSSDNVEERLVQIGCQMVDISLEEKEIISKYVLYCRLVVEVQ